MPDTVAGPKAASKNNKHLENLLIEFLIDRSHKEREGEKRDEPNQDVGHSVAPVGPGCLIRIFNRLSDVVHPTIPVGFRSANPTYKGYFDFSCSNSP